MRGVCPAQRVWKECLRECLIDINKCISKNINNVYGHTNIVNIYWHIKGAGGRLERGGGGFFSEASYLSAPMALNQNYFQQHESRMTVADNKVAISFGLLTSAERNQALLTYLLTTYSTCSSGMILVGKNRDP
jgi:hypothetical protein